MAAATQEEAGQDNMQDSAGSRSDNNRVVLHNPLCSFKMKTEMYCSRKSQTTQKQLKHWTPQKTLNMIDNNSHEPTLLTSSVLFWHLATEMTCCVFKDDCLVRKEKCSLLFLPVSYRQDRCSQRQEYCSSSSFSSCTGDQSGCSDCLLFQELQRRDQVV